MNSAFHNQITKYFVTPICTKIHVYLEYSKSFDCESINSSNNQKIMELNQLSYQILFTKLTQYQIIVHAEDIYIWRYLARPLLDKTLENTNSHWRLETTLVLLR